MEGAECVQESERVRSKEIEMAAKIDLSASEASEET
jgi:hypothetical protein